MTRDGVAQVERGGLDLAFVALPLDPSPVVRTRLIAREPLGRRACPLDHRLAREPAVDLATWPDDGFITTPVAVGSGLQEAGQRACVDAGFRPRIVQEITDPFMILTLVAAGVGVALISAEVAGIMPSGSVYVPLRGEPVHLNHAIAWSADNPSTVLKAVLSVAEEVLPTPDDCALLHIMNERFGVGQCMFGCDPRYVHCRACHRGVAVVLVGIVGCGNIAANHVVAFREAGVEVVACADVDAGRADGFRRTHEIPAAVTSVDALLDLGRTSSASAPPPDPRGRGDGRGRARCARAVREADRGRPALRPPDDCGLRRGRGDARRAVPAPVLAGRAADPRRDRRRGARHAVPRPRGSAAAPGHLVLHRRPVRGRWPRTAVEC
jgi:hypothetical protein